jgi:hypothetical protein
MGRTCARTQWKYQWAGLRLRSRGWAGWARRRRAGPGPDSARGRRGHGLWPGHRDRASDWPASDLIFNSSRRAVTVRAHVLIITLLSLKSKPPRARGRRRRIFKLARLRARAAMSQRARCQCHGATATAAAPASGSASSGSHWQAGSSSCLWQGQATRQPQLKSRRS